MEKMEPSLRHPIRYRTARLSLIKPGKRGRVRTANTGGLRYGGVAVLILLLFLGGSVRGQSTLYWVGGQGEWNNVTHWATSSGGSIHPLTAPGPTDHVIFDNNGMNDGDTVFVFENPALCANMTWTTNKFVTLYATKALNVFGSFVWSNTVQNNFSGGLYFSATAPGKTIDTKGTEISGTVYFDGIGGEWTLLSNLEVFFQIYLNAGTLNTANRSVRAMHFYSTANYPRTLNLGNSTFTCYFQSPAGAYSWVVDYSTSFNLTTGGNSLIRFTSGGISRMKAGDGLSYDNIDFYGRGILISSGTIYKNVLFGTAKTLYPGSNYTGRIGENLTFSNNNIFNNITFYDHGSIIGDNNNILQELVFMGNGSLLSGSNQCLWLKQYRYYPYLGGTLPNTLTLQAGQVQSATDGMELFGNILCDHTIITSSATTGLAGLYTGVPLLLDYADLRYIHGRNGSDPAGAGIAPDTAWNSLNTGCMNWVFPDNFSIPHIGSATLTQVAPCHNSNNGQIVVHAAGGMATASLQFKLDGPVSSGWQTDSVFSNLPAGDYTVTLREVRGISPDGQICFVSNPYPYTITAPAPLMFTAIDHTNPGCYDSCNATLLIHATGGTLPYEYCIDWNPASQSGVFQSGNFFEGLCAGTYNTFMVKHSGQCYFEGSSPVVEITAPLQLAVSTLTVNSVSCNGLNDGSVAAQATGGTGDYTYTIHPEGSANPTGIFTNLTPGTYSISVTDENGCTGFSAPFTITEPTAIQILSVTAVQISCNGITDGSLLAEATGGSGQLVYTLNPGGSSNTSGLFTGLGPGIYTIAVNDENNCIFHSDPIEITDPPLLQIVSIQSTHISCFNYNDGTISVEAAGGTGSYTFTLLPGHTSQDTGFFQNLPAGNYTVRVTDGNACTTLSNVITIANPSPLSVTTSQSPALCHNSLTGCAFAQAGGGTPPYFYLWNNVSPPVANDTLCAITGGIYTVVVNDSNGCTANSFVIVEQPLPITVGFSTGGYANPSPPPLYLYFAEAIPAGGTPPYTHHWENGNTTATISDVPEGVYTDTIRDANGCIRIDSVYLQALDCRIAAFRDVQCFGAGDGWALAEGLGGNTPYNYAWRVAGEPGVIGNNAFISGLMPGDYEITITDANIISVTCGVSIVQPPPISIAFNTTTVSCTGQTGTIFTEIAGGTPYVSPPRATAYNYLWSNLATTPSVNVPAGTYGLIVTDSLNCQSTATATLNQPEEIEIVSATGTNMSCHNVADGTCTVIASGGSGSLLYTLYPGLTMNYTGVFTGLNQGSYHVVVSDANGCEATGPVIVILNPDPVQILSTDYQHPACNGSQDGWIHISGAGGTEPLAYYLNPGNIYSPTGAFEGLGAGSYTVVVTDINLCPIATSATIHLIDPPPILIVSEESQPITCHDASDASMTTLASGGSGQLWYMLNPTGTVNQTGFFENLGPGSYSVTVADENGCQITGSEIFFQNPALLEISNVEAIPPSCYGFANGSLTVAASGGTGLHAFSIDNGLTFSPNPFFDELPAGSYTVWVYDENGCAALYTGNPVILINPPALSLDFITQNPSCFGCMDGEITAIAGGGIPPYTHHWNNGANTATISGLQAGIYYSDTLRDSNGCQVIDSVILSEPGQFSVNHQSGDVSCPGGSNGWINTTIEGGTPPYAYTWTKSPESEIISTEPDLSGLIAGMYNLVVTDAFGYQAFAAIPVHQPDPFSIQFTSGTDSLCPEDLSGWITALTGGGTPPYSYQWSAGNWLPARPDSIFGLGPGNYVLTITDLQTCSFASVDILYPFPSPAAQFSADTVCHETATPFVFIPSSTGANPVEWRWDFGDGAGTIKYFPESPDTGHQYDSPGYYTAILTTVSAHGCISNPYSEMVVVKHKPQAAFSSTSDCFGIPTQFTDLSTLASGSIASWTWEFGNAATSNVQNPSYIFPDPGPQTVTLTVQSDENCYGSITQIADVYHLPEAGFLWTNPCSSTIVEFTDTSYSQSAPVISWLWNFGDGSSSTVQNPIHIYPTSGTYTVSLTVATSEGCVQTISHSIYIQPETGIDFVWDTACFGHPTHFSGFALDAGLVITGWDWNFGDGQTGSGASVTHTYQLPGLYQVFLSSTDTAGCIRTVSHQVEVYSLPVVSFDYQAQCIDIPVVFTDLSPGSPVAWLWDFGDGSASVQQHPLHTYAYAGTYTVALTLTSGYACTNALSKTVTVANPPVALFSADTVCFGSSSHFSDLSYSATGSIISWQWDFGDGQGSSIQNPAHTFGAPGWYNVSLIVQNQAGCTDTLIQAVRVRQLPQAAIGVQPACVYAPTLFTDLSVSANGPVVSWQWNFGDGNGSNLQNPDHIYLASGNYSVNLLVSDQQGCQSGTSFSVSPLPLPVAAFGFSGNACGNTPVQFADQSNGNGTNLISWVWDFGDGNSSTVQNPAHQYAVPGVYQVILTVGNENGCSASATQTVVTGVPPAAAFSSSNQCYPQAVQFNDLSTTLAGFILQWAWDFGDPASGAANQSAMQHPVHVFTGPGNYWVTLIATNSSLCTDTITQLISVEPGPAADFSFVSGCLGTMVVFTDLSQPAAFPIVSWQWDFGNGNSSNQQNPEHQYQQSGQFMVSLMVTDANGCQSAMTKVVSIGNLPTALFQFANECAGQSTFFTDYSNGAGSAIVQWAWDFGDPLSGGSNNSNLQNPVHVFQNTGNYQVSLTVTNALGCSGTVIQTVMVLPSPVADFEAGTTCVAQPVNFNNLSYSNGSSITGWQWDFGDGTSSGLAFPVHTYQNVGVYQVSLTVTNASGCIAQVIKPVNIHPLPIVNFDYLLPNCSGDTTFLINLTSFAGGGSAATWYWDFGDGSTSTAQSPSHIYQNPGNYPVTLTATDHNGCTNAIVKTVTVGHSPTAAFNFSNLGCGSFQFTDLSTDPIHNITAWYWNFGDPGSGTANYANTQNPQHQFSMPGTYTVTLMAVNSEGCSGVSTRQVVVTSPVAMFAWIPDPPCPNVPVQFTNQSFSSGSTIVSWLWNFGDGSTSALPNPSHVYSSGGNYLVSLTVTDSQGCQAMKVESVAVAYQPIAQFQFSQPACAGLPTQFTDNSSTAGGASITAWQWSFGNGNTSSLQNPAYTYNLPATYNVSLTITDANGCQATKNRSLKISQPPLAHFAYTLANCNQAGFTDLTTCPDTTITAWLWNFGDPASGPNNISTLQNPQHTYNQPGSYTITLQTWSAAGCGTTTTQTLTIQAPQSGFACSPGCAGNTTQFTDQSVANGIPITQWYWEFGDGSTSTMPSPVHIYSSGGNYQASLLVTNAIGCQSMLNQLIAIQPPPLADFSFDTPCYGQSTQFIDESTSPGNTPVVSWLWNFGDGGISSLQNPAHTYAMPGTYFVSLQIANAAGCTGIIQKTAVVHPVPLANFSQQIPDCDTVFFTDFSAGGGSPVVAWRWNFGDPGSGMYNTSTQQNPWHLFSLPGTYNVRLVAINSNGCRDTIVQSVVFDPFPQPDFSFTTACSGTATQFTAINTSGNIISYSWDFGDGTPGSGPSPEHVYTQPGIYSVTLIVTNNNLCTNYMTKQVTVLPSPVVNFSWSNPACTGSPVQLMNQTSGSGNLSQTYLWLMGDGTAYTIAEPVHAYSAPGIYAITLIVENLNGCIDSLTKHITVYANPVADFVSSQACLGFPVQFTDMSQPAGSPVTAWYWAFGDGTSLPGIQHPSHVYANAGIYNVTLSITDANGCQASVVHPAQVNPLPLASFITQAGSLCEGDTVFFTSLSTPEWQIVDHQWFFGDPVSGNADTSSFTNPYHVYENAGTYHVTLIVTNTNGCIDDTVKAVTILPKPVVNFIYTPACANDTTFFTDLSYVPGGTPLTGWEWTFGDGSGSSIQHPWHVYNPTTGDTTYSVSLAVTAATGCKQSQTQLVPVFGPPAAGFAATFVCEGNVTYFTNSSSTPSGVLVSYDWDFGDGATSSLPNPTHLYSQSGSYSVTLIAGNSNGCYDTAAGVVEVFPLPLAHFFSDTVCFGDSTHFTDLSFLPYGSINSWYWSFGDPASGVHDTSTLQNPAHRFTHAGIFNVTLMAGDTNGCSGTIVIPVKVDSLPVPQFIHTPATCQYTAIAFDDLSIATDNPIHWWMWRFGDGSDTTIYAPATPDVSHIYQNQGLFTATLIVSDAKGCMDSISHVLTIYPLPEAMFSYHDTACTAGLVYFDDQSNGIGTNISSWLWDFDYPGQNYSTQQNPYYFYTQTNTSHVVMLMVEDANGCRDTLFDTVFIKPGLEVDFTFSNSCHTDSVHFYPIATQPTGDTLLQAAWTFGDGSVSGELFPAHVYPAPGLYYVQLRGVNQNGCEAVTFKPVFVNHPPEAAFSAPPAGCHEPTVFTDSSLAHSDSIVSWRWDFGDGSDTLIFAPANPNTAHYYPETGGVYQAMLTVTNSNGCSSTGIQEVVRLSCLSAGFTAINQGCAGKSVVFVDQSAAGSGAVSIAQWFWDFGDGHQSVYTSRHDTIAHTYDQPGAYIVRQILTAVTAGTVYIDTAFVTVQVYNSPEAEFTHTPGCQGVAVQFKDYSTGPGSPITSWQWDFGDGTASGETNPSHVFTGVSDYLVSLVVTNMQGCSDTMTRWVNTSRVPDVVLSVPSALYCADTVTVLLSEVSGTQGANWSWDFGDGSNANTSQPTISHTFEAGEWEIILSLTTPEGCRAADTTRIVVNPLPVARFSFKPDSVGIVSGEVNFLDESYGIGSPLELWHWDFGNGRDTMAVNPVYHYRDTGTYVVTQTVTDLHGCTSKYSRKVRVFPELRFFVPTAFSPNQNGRNDVFRPMGRYLKSGQYHFQVFNRWGQLLFETTNPDEGWDGRVRNEECPVGVYIWTVSLYDLYNDKEFHKGNVMLIR